jgi:hypothetical protein
MVSSTTSLPLSEIRLNAPVQEKTKPYPWIVNPIFDVLFVFGGLVWVILIAQVLVFGWNVPELTHQHPEMVKALLVSNLIGQYMFADAHTAATYMRVYDTKESRKQFWFYGNVLPFGSLILFVLALIYPVVAGAVVYIHLMWVYQHYTAQSFGISLIYCYKRGFIMSHLEKEVFRWLNFFLAAFVIARVLTSREFSPSNYYGVDLPFWGLPPVITHITGATLVALCFLFVMLLIRKAIVEGSFIPFPAVAMTASVGAIGLSTGYANAIFWTYGPQYFHGSQYLAVSLGYHLKEKNLPLGMTGSQIMSMLLTKDAFRWMSITVLAGIFIYVGVPSTFQQLGYSFVAVATVLQACINFHHFLTDAAIWRLRDPNCKKVLVA